MHPNQLLRTLRGSAVSGVLALLAGSGTLAAQTAAFGAGPDRILTPPEVSVTMQGFVRAPQGKASPGGSTRTIAWTQVSGAPVNVLDGDTLTPTVIPSQSGTVRMRLTLIDARLGTLTDDALIHTFGTDQDGVLTGEARKWHKLSLTFTHDTVLSETGPLNPFLDARLVVYFLHESGSLRTVPGFFAADGNAAETGATSGDKWRVNFSPDLAGAWFYLASFRGGTEVAIKPSLTAGVPLSFDGANGSFFVEAHDPNAPGFLGKGRLKYVGAHHLQFAETGEYFLKGGAGSPENFLGYYEFDGTSDTGGTSSDLNNFGYFDGLHHYDAHLGDYVDLGVPLWQGNKGRRIFGALSYLSSQGVNSLYALSYNVDGGDGREVWPWVTPSDKEHFDVSKLAQWERTVDHMSRAGIVWHVITQEFENDHALDGGELGTHRSLYYRELVARFAHSLGLVWNLGEENTNTPEQRRAFADGIRALDPYRHPITVHNVVGDLAGTFGTLLGTHLELVSLQGDPTMTPPRARQLVLDSADAGRPWVVNFDEQTPAFEGVPPDSVDFWHGLHRRESLWPMLMGQGGGCEWYFGYGHPHSDLDLEDFRSRENLWVLTRLAREFVRDHVPFWDMDHADSLASGVDPSVLAKRGEFYLVYVPFGGSVTLDLQAHTGPFRVSWFDARNGGSVVDGAVTQVSGPGTVSLGSAPSSADWVAWVRPANNLAPTIDSIDIDPDPFVNGRDVTVQVHATDPNGPADDLTVTADLIGPLGKLTASFALPHQGGSLYTNFTPNADLPSGNWKLEVTVQDEAGATTTQDHFFVVP